MEGYIGHMGSSARFMYTDGGLYRAYGMLTFMYRVM